MSSLGDKMYTKRVTPVPFHFRQVVLRAATYRPGREHRPSASECWRLSPRKASCLESLIFEIESPNDEKRNEQDSDRQNLWLCVSLGGGVWSTQQSSGISMEVRGQLRGAYSPQLCESQGLNSGGGQCLYPENHFISPKSLCLQALRYHTCLLGICLF